MPKISRRHPAAIALLLMLGLLLTGAAYAAVAPQPAKAATSASGDAEHGKKLFTANCANCHGANGLGIDGLGPSLAGVGAAAVDFQMGTGRMPMTEPGVQAADDLKVKFSDEEISGLNIPTGQPLVYELDESFQPVEKGGRYLDPVAAKAAAEAVANQGKNQGKT